MPLRKSYPGGSPSHPEPAPALRTLLARHTDARVLLARAGDAVATADQLAFQLDHAQARDAVHAVLNPQSLAEQITALGLTPLPLASAVPDRATYLRRPDLGRILDDASGERLPGAAPFAPDVLFLIADGLSALATERHALPLLTAILPHLAAWSIGPVPILTQARVALADQVGAALHARLTVLLIGERPGLSAPDSLGVYLTWNPHPTRTDAERNCISNIRVGGLSYAEAAQRTLALMTQARTLAYTGVHLKEAAADALPTPPDVAQLHPGMPGE